MQESAAADWRATAQAMGALVIGFSLVTAMWIVIRIDRAAKTQRYKQPPYFSALELTTGKQDGNCNNHQSK